MKESHAHLKITEREWDAMVVDFVKVLDKNKVAKADQQELLARGHRRHRDRGPTDRGKVNLAACRGGSLAGRPPSHGCCRSALISSTSCCAA
jgi:hemoglobin